LGCLGGKQALRHCAFTVNPHRPASLSAGAPTWLTKALVEWNALLTILAPGGVADIVSVTMALLSIKDFAVAISTRAGPEKSVIYQNFNTTANC